MKALTVGGAMLDSVAIIADDRIEQMAMTNADTSYLLLEEGKKTETREISTHSGGGAINAAVSMARIGLDVRVLAKMGRDYKSETILAKLKNEGINTQWIVYTDEAPTGSSVIIASHDRDAAIFTFRGANTLIRPEDLADEAFDVDLLYISSLSNESADCFPLLAAKGKAHGAFVATNPGIRQLSSRSDAFYQSLKDINLLSLNHIEANALVPHLVSTDGEGGPALECDSQEDVPKLVTRGFSAGGFEITLAHFIKGMLKRGLRYMLVTSGKQGAFLAWDDQLIFCPALKNVNVAGTAGGGDAFASTLTACLILGKSPEQSMQIATLNAASVISFADTQTGLLHYEALESKLNEHQHEMPIRRWDLP